MINCQPLFSFWMFIICGLVLLSRSLADLSFYVNTNAPESGDSNLNELKKVFTTCEYLTSSAYLAGTEDTVSITFIGDFSSSGPHEIDEVGAFEAGSTFTKTIQLSRVIGNLKSVLFQKKGTDGWLLSKMRCTMDDMQYELSGQPAAQWLDNFDPVTARDNNGDGYEPLAQLPLPASSQIQLQVSESFRVHKTATSSN